MDSTQGGQPLGDRDRPGHQIAVSRLRSQVAKLMAQDRSRISEEAVQKQAAGRSIGTKPLGVGGEQGMDRADGQGRGASAPSGLGEAGEVAEVSERPRIASAQGIELHRQPPEPPVGRQIVQPKGLDRRYGDGDLPAIDLQSMIAWDVHALQRKAGVRVETDIHGPATFKLKPTLPAARTAEGAERLSHLGGDEVRRRRGGQTTTAVL